METIKTKQYLICYIDILGYKQLIEKYGEDQFLHYIICTMNTIQDIMQENNELLYPVQYHIFSDNVIIFSPLSADKTDNEFLTREYIANISILQRNLMGQYGIFIRGCITIGNLYYDGNFIYGSGLIKAYQIENNKAVYPRIILDNECIEMCTRIDSLAYGVFMSDYIAKEEDMFFLNYLCGIKYFSSYIKETNTVIKDKVNYINTSSYTKFPDPFYSIDFSDNQAIQEILVNSGNRNIGIYYLLVHKVLVEANLLQQTDAKVLDKYIWCKNFHNRICAKNGLFELSIQ